MEKSVKKREFPTFKTPNHIKMPGFKFHDLKCPKCHMLVTGKWFNYSLMFFVLLVDVMMLKNNLFYKPEDCGQYVGPDEHVWTVMDPETVDGKITVYTWEERQGLNGDFRTAARFSDAPMALKMAMLLPCLAVFAATLFMIRIRFNENAEEKLTNKPDLSGFTKPELPAVIIPGRFDPNEAARASAEVSVEMSESAGEISPATSTAGSPAGALPSSWGPGQFNASDMMGASVLETPKSPAKRKKPLLPVTLAHMRAQHGESSRELTQVHIKIEEARAELTAIKADKQQLLGEMLAESLKLTDMRSGNLAEETDGLDDCVDRPSPQRIANHKWQLEQLEAKCDRLTEELRAAKAENTIFNSEKDALLTNLLNGSNDVDIELVLKQLAQAQQQRAEADQELMQMNVQISKSENEQKDVVWKLQAKHDVQLAGMTEQMALKDKRSNKAKNELEKHVRRLELELQMSNVDEAGKKVAEQSKQLSDQIDRQDEQSTAIERMQTEHINRVSELQNQLTTSKEKLAKASRRFATYEALAADHTREAEQTRCELNEQIIDLQQQLSIANEQLSESVSKAAGAHLEDSETQKVSENALKESNQRIAELQESLSLAHEKRAEANEKLAEANHKLTLAHKRLAAQPVVGTQAENPAPGRNSKLRGRIEDAAARGNAAAPADLSSRIKLRRNSLGL